eukprot:3392535-Rhodomonas_salina.1
MAQSYKQNKKRDAKALPDHLQGKAGRGVKRRRLDPSTDLRGTPALFAEPFWGPTRSVFLVCSCWLGFGCDVRAGVERRRVRPCSHRHVAAP